MSSDTDVRMAIHTAAVVLSLFIGSMCVAVGAFYSVHVASAIVHMSCSAACHSRKLVRVSVSSSAVHRSLRLAMFRLVSSGSFVLCVHIMCVLFWWLLLSAFASFHSSFQMVSVAL